MDKKEARLDSLIVHLKKNNASGIRELADMYGVSMMTIRRDLEVLRERRIIKFFHGGAVYNPEYKDENDHFDYLLQKQKLLHIEEKIRVAKKAASLILPQETVMLDAGTTIYYLSREIDNDIPLTAICWSLNVIDVLIKKPLCSIISRGGLYHPETQMFENFQKMELIESTRASKAFISAGGVHPELGVTCSFPYEIETKKTAIRSSMSSILVVDSSKFGKVRTTHIGGIDDFDIVITDSHISDEYKDFILSKNIELIIA